MRVRTVGRPDRFVRFGEAGTSDLLGVGPGGRFVAVECKRHPNVLTSSQQRFLLEVHDRGGFAVCVYAVEELMEEWRRQFGEGKDGAAARKAGADAA